jgi:hypothetical protein
MTRRRRAQVLEGSIRPEQAYRDACRTHSVPKKIPHEAQRGLKALFSNEGMHRALDEVMQYDAFADGFPHGHLRKLIGMKAPQVRWTSPTKNVSKRSGKTGSLLTFHRRRS